EYKQGAFNEPAQPAAADTALGQEAIILAGEVKKNLSSPQAQPDNASASTPQASQNPASLCYEAGPFADQNDYKNWRNELAVAANHIKTLTKNEQTIVGYIVVYPAAENPSKTAENLQKLKKLGITDVWLLNKGPQQGDISLGSFNKEEQALLQQKALQDKGITAEIKPKYKIKTQLYAELHNDAQLTENLPRMQASYPQITVTALTHCSTP
ncbi:MAG: hypothetical protein ABL925_16150, partial [Methylococcales bacterium]